MDLRGLRRLAAIAAAVLAPPLAGPGCAEERAAVDRVQPDALDKTDFIPVQYAALVGGARPEAVGAAELAREPVYYTQTTMIAKPTTTGFVGLTSYSNMEKVRWEVTENVLLARQAYRFVRGAPGGAEGVGQNPREGDVVAAFTITSHFDIRREYEPATGEEINVVSENTTDRPWYRRRYMRVDWSRNLVDGYNSVLEYEHWEGRVQAEPVPVFVNNPQDANAPVFSYETRGGHRGLAYFDVVNRALLHPERVNLGPDLPNVPLCVLGTGETSCAPAEVTLRLAFRRADPTRDYEPASLSVPLPGQASAPAHLDQERFGFFDQMRLGFDPRHHAILDTQRVHLAARHNVWVHHHALAFGPGTGAGCDGDADCAEGTRCRIGNAPRDATHRGVCAPPAAQHLAGASEPACQRDADCRFGPRALSSTAVCDATTRTCGEVYFRCSADSDCAAVDPQSTCDLAIAHVRPDNRGLCLMPFRQRQVRPLAYHLSPNYPAAMMPVTEAVVAEWNEAFEAMVAAARRRECEVERSVTPDTPAAENPCNTPAVHGTDAALGADGRHVFVGCHNPVWGANPDLPGYHPAPEVTAARAAGWDTDACGPQGTSARLGDLRYNMIASITDHDAQGYWGLANIAADPETGEMVAGRGAVWQTVTDTYASYLVELVRVLVGEVQPTDLASGRYLADSMEQLGSGRTPGAATFDAPLRAPGGLAAIAAADREGLGALRLPDAGWLTPGGRLRLRSRDPDQPGALDLAARRLHQGRLLGDGASRAATRRGLLRGTELEGMLMNPQQARLAPTAAPDLTGALPATLDAASPLRGQSPARRRALARLRARLSAWQCNHEAAFSDDALYGLARRLARGEPISPTNPEDAPVAFGREWNFRTADGGLDYELMRRYAAQFIHHGVLAHEIGHSLGQRHNFTASADALNYHDGYWALRGRGHARGVRPRYEYLADPADGQYYSREEIEGRIEEYSYSSVMDYKGLNEDARGLGRYDRAFVRHGYAGLVEAFRRVADRDGALVYGVNHAGGGLSTPLDLREWSRGGAPHGMHYSQIPALFGRRADGTPDVREDNRYDVFLRETRREAVAGWGDPDFTNVTRDGHVLVPYRFDSDERANLVWQNQLNDAGADAYESLRYVATRYIDYYFANSFARYRSGFSTEAYVARMWGRYVDQLRQTAQTLAFDLVSYQDFLATAPGWARYRDDPAEAGGFVAQLGTSVAADAFVAMLTMPEIGLHRAQEQADGVRLVTPNLETNRGFPVPINAGRGFESTWRSDVGFWWYEQLYRAGSYYDKVLALDAFTDPELLLLTRDTPTDLRLFQLSFYTMYPDATVRLFGALLAEDWEDFAPVVDLDGEHAITRTHLATLNLPRGAGAGQSGRVFDATHAALDPQTHFTMQLYAAVFTVAQFPATFDQRYMDFTRVWTDGSVEAVAVTDPDRNTVSFTDPWSRLTYRALHIGTGPGEAGARVGASPLVHPATGATADEAGIGARMLLHLRDLDALRLRARAARDAAREAALEAQERKYLDLVHVMRRLTATFGAGQITTR